MRHTYADTSRARADLGFAPTVGLEAGPRGRVSMADWNTVINTRHGLRLTSGLRLCARGCWRWPSRRPAPRARAAPSRPAPPSRTSSCSTRAPTRSTTRSGSTAREFFKQVTETYTASPYRPDAKLGHRRHLPRRRHRRSARPRDQRVHASSSPSTRPTAAPTTRSTSWAWRTSARCACRSAIRPRRATRCKEFDDLRRALSRTAA